MAMNSPAGKTVAPLPSQQRLHRSRFVPLEAHLRLVVHHELARLDGAAQRLLDAEVV